MAMLKKGEGFKPVFLNKFTFRCTNDLCNNEETIEAEGYPDNKTCSKCESKMIIASFSGGVLREETK